MSSGVATAENIRSAIDHGPVKPAQVGVVILCALLNMIDGFDVLVMAFTAPPIAEDWDLPLSELGALLSSGLIGMTIGAMFIAPYADFIGRRKLILWCLAGTSLGMLASAMSQSVLQLGALRFLTGLGIGGMMASLNIMVAEYTPAKRRSLAIAVLQSAYPLGGIVGGSISVYLIAQYSWQATFIFGGLLSAVMIPVVYLALPESPDFLVHRQPTGALVAINRIMKRLRLDAFDSMPAPEGERISRPDVRRIFTPAYRNNTLMIWTAYVAHMASIYFILSWTPKLLVDAGMSTSEGISGSVILQIGGITGSLLLGALAARINVRILTSTTLTLGVAAMIAFAVTEIGSVWFFVLAASLGFFSFAGMIGLYSITPTLYKPEVRVTGMGWATGFGRIGGIVAPLVAGVLLESGWTGEDSYILFAVPMMIAAIAVWRIR
jgi:benzoate transport